MRCIWGMRMQYNCIKGSYYSMPLTRKAILLVFIANILLAFLCAYILDPPSFFSDPEMFWQLPLVITIFSVTFFVFSRIAEVAINKKSKTNAVYFWGQIPVTLIILGFFW